jgi:pyruvate dehydrogenase kinase 2/3/4
VSDEGGGIKREQMGRVFAFLYTTARDNPNSFDDVEDFGTQSPMAGLGYGLPVARLYARYSTGSLIGYSIGYSRLLEAQRVLKYP